MKKIQELKYLYLALSLKALFACLLISYSSIGLAPDEAQYWTWSQDLSFGYYSKPPGIAWQIFLGTQIWGNTELGTRFASVIISFLLALATYSLSRSCGAKHFSSLCSSIVMSFCPIGILSSFAATTDGGFILFWILACTVFAKALSTHTKPNYISIGMLIACGALFKWPIYILWIFILAFSLYIPHLKNKNLLTGILVSLIGFLPSILWNYSNDWSTFLHVFYTIFPQSIENSKESFTFKGNPLEFLGAQIGILSPLYFFFLLPALKKGLSKTQRANKAIFFCSITSVSILALHFALSFFQKIQANWASYAYPGAIVVSCWYLTNYLPHAKRWLSIATIISLFLSLFAISLPFIQKNDLLNPLQIPYRINPFRHSLGWKNLQRELDKAGYDPKKHFLFSDKYQMTSILSFYGKAQKRAYFLNLHNNRKNQFSYWPGMDTQQLGQTGYFVLTENSSKLEDVLTERIAHYQRQLTPYFESVEFLGIKPLFWANGHPVKGMLFFKCLNYNGLKTKSSSSY